MSRNHQPNSYFIVGESRTNSDNAITHIYNSFYMAFEVDKTTYMILDYNVTHTLPLTETYLRRVFINQCFPEVDNWLEDVLRRNYGGSSRKAVLTAYRDALKKFNAMIGENGPA